jgi:hypothetical protein
MTRPPDYVYYQLGQLGVPWQQVPGLIDAARAEAAKVLKMSAKGRVPIPGTAPPRVLVYDAVSAHWSIEEAPVKTADALVREAMNIVADGRVPPLPGSAWEPWAREANRYFTSQYNISLGSPAAHVVKPVDGNENGFLCSCGRYFTSEHGWAWCPEDPTGPCGKRRA